MDCIASIETRIHRDLGWLFTYIKDFPMIMIGPMLDFRGYLLVRRQDDDRGGDPMVQDAAAPGSASIKEIAIAYNYTVQR